MRGQWLWLPFELLLFTPSAFQFSALVCMYVCIMHIALNKNVLSHGNSDDNYCICRWWNSEGTSVESNRVVGYCRPQSSGPENSSLKKAGSSANR